MYNFILNCWKLGKVTEDDVQIFVTKGFITAEQAKEITAAPQQAQ